jgi:hypothetical protein
MQLTEEQIAAVRSGEPVRLAAGGERLVVLREDVFERLRELVYDDSPWTDEEMESLAWEAGRHAGWDDMPEYDHYEKP